MESAENKAEHTDKEIEVGADQKSKPEEKKGVENKSKTNQPTVAEGDSLDGQKVIWYNTKEEGFIHGILGLENDDFETFLEAKQEMSLSSILLGKIREKKAELKAKIDALPGKRSSLKRTSIEAEQERKLLHSEIEILEEKNQGLIRQLNMLSLEVKKINPYYSWLFAILFIIAGFTFMAGDLLYTRIIAFDVLNMEGVEAWILASAVALLALVLKPAIDRIFENPYQQNRHIKRNHGLFIGVSIVVLTTLGFLGILRSKIIAIDARGLSDGIDLLSLQFERVGNFPTQFVLTMLSMLLAISGAICFSVGVPVLKESYRRRVLNKRIKEKQDFIQANEASSQKHRHRISELTAIKEMADFEYTHLEDPLVLQKQLDSIDEEEVEEIRSMFESKIKEKLGYYREAIAKGRKVQLSGDLVMSSYQLYRTLGLPAWPSSGNGRSRHKQNYRGEEKDADSEFLHQRLRDLLRHEFKTKSK